MNVHNQEGLLSSFQKVPCREMQESEGHREFIFKSKKKKKADKCADRKSFERWFSAVIPSWLGRHTDKTGRWQGHSGVF